MKEQACSKRSPLAIDRSLAGSSPCSTCFYSRCKKIVPSRSHSLDDRAERCNRRSGTASSRGPRYTLACRICIPAATCYRVYPLAVELARGFPLRRNRGSRSPWLSAENSIGGSSARAPAREVRARIPISGHARHSRP